MFECESFHELGIRTKRRVDENGLERRIEVGIESQGEIWSRISVENIAEPNGSEFLIHIAGKVVGTISGSRACKWKISAEQP